MRRGHLCIVPPPMIRWSAIFCLIAGVFAAGCKGQCQLLAESICNCSLSASQQTTCLNTVDTENGRLNPDSDQNALCQQLAPGCSCYLVATSAGKVACGLARSSGDAGVVQ
jgi:hypothetical protein